MAEESEIPETETGQEAATNMQPPGPAPESDGDPTAHNEVAKDQLADAVDGEAEGLDPAMFAIAAERDQYLESSRRVQAEFENYRKQAAKRETEGRLRANEKLVSELLPVLDACEAAVQNGSQDIPQIHTALFEALVKQGLEKVDPQGEPFDPELHEAVMHSEDDSTDVPTVVEVLRNGYVWKGRVLRPAMVSVKG